jgi:hypothetical protein
MMALGGTRGWNRPAFARELSQIASMHPPARKQRTLLEFKFVGLIFRDGAILQRILDF